MDLTLLPFVVLGFFAVISIVLLVVRARSNASRREAVASSAMTLGFEYAEEDPDLLESDFSRLPLFGKGRRRRAVNVLRRAEGEGEVLLFDFRYTTGGGSNNTTIWQTVAAFRRDGLDLPPFELRPENALIKLASTFGYQDIDFDSFPEFSKRYLLRGEDEAAIRSRFGPGVLQGLERNLGWWIEGAGPLVLLYRQGKRVKPSELYDFLNDTREVVRLLQLG